MYNNHRGRPTLPERFSTLEKLRNVRDILVQANAAYQDEQIESAIEMMNQMIREQWSDEEIYRNDELKELWGNLGKLPYSVRVWVTDPYLRDHEMN